jgi:6-hydroxynicotinate 3-monooxygenase
MLPPTGHDVAIYEQAAGFSRIGAGIQLGPNVLKIMRRLGLKKRSRPWLQADAWISYAAQDASVLADIPLNRRREEYRGYVRIHRRISTRCWSIIPGGTPAFRSSCRRVEQDDQGVTLTFERQEPVRAGLVIGADGVNSVIREALLGPKKPLYTGYVGHRAIFPAARREAASSSSATSGGRKTGISWSITSMPPETRCIS